MPANPLAHLLKRNRAWSEAIKADDPEFFTRLVGQQAPEYLWIGCSDSRVPANEIVDLLPGEMFVHRNVANVVVHTDLNCLSVLQYAVDVLKVKHVIVVRPLRLRRRAGRDAEPEARPDQQLAAARAGRAAEIRRPLAQLAGEELRADRLCELNVIEQVVNVCQTTVVESAWERGQNLSVHGWIYRLSDGRVRDLRMNVSATVDIAACREEATHLLLTQPLV